MRAIVPFCSHAYCAKALQVVERNGRPEWPRTIELFRVKEALSPDLATGLHGNCSGSGQFRLRWDRGCFQRWADPTRQPCLIARSGVRGMETES
jgi:hypothetical protein